MTGTEEGEATNPGTRKLVSRIKQVMHDQKVNSVTELARLSGVTQSTLQRLLAGKIEAPKLVLVQAIAKGLGVSVMALIDEGGITPSEMETYTEGLPESDNRLVMTLCRLLKAERLTPGDKALLEQMMRRLGSD